MKELVVVVKLPEAMMVKEGEPVTLQTTKLKKVADPRCKICGNYYSFDCYQCRQDSYYTNLTPEENKIVHKMMTKKMSPEDHACFVLVIKEMQVKLGFCGEVAEGACCIIVMRRRIDYYENKPIRI